MSVVGFDFGNMQSCIAVARNRGIDIICNEVSNRFTPYVSTLMKILDPKKFKLNCFEHALKMLCTLAFLCFFFEVVLLCTDC
jgi:hypothetical protein